MLALIIIGWIVGSILVYLTTGTIVSRKAAPLFWRKATMKYGDGTGGGYYASERPARTRRSVREQAEVMVIFWPVALCVLMISRALDGSIDEHDPAEIERREKEQKARIAELEKQLGINQPEKPVAEYDLLTRGEFNKLDGASRQAYLAGHTGETHLFLDDFSSKFGLMRNYDQDDLDEYSDRVKRASRRWLGDV